MEIFIKKHTRNSLIISIFLIILSIFLIVNPTGSLIMFVKILGIISIVGGIVHIISYFSTAKEFVPYSFELIQGIIYLIAGCILFFNPVLVNSFLPFVIGTGIIIQSIIKIQISLNVREVVPKWSIALLLSVLMFIIGLVILFNPFGTAMVIARLCGIILLISEIISVIGEVLLMKN